MSEQNNRQDMNDLQKRYSKAEIDAILPDDTDEAPTEWVPSRFEKRVNAIPEGQWTLLQALGGTIVGAAVVFALFLGGEGSGFSWGLLVAVALALFLPNWLEDRCRRKLTKARYIMIAVIAVGIVGMVLFTGLTKGWDVFMMKQK